MEAYDIDEVRRCYGLTAAEYAEKFLRELEDKPFDREVLGRFAASVDAEGLTVDFGCGSGHIAACLRARGLKNVLGVDLSAESIALARRTFPEPEFETGNMLASRFADGSLAGVVCFYGIVHFTYEEIGTVLAEWKRILRPGGRALFSFHVGEDESIRVEGFLGKEGANATWNCFRVETVLAIMEGLGLAYDEVVVRHPYLGKEHPSRRCYVQLTKT